MTDINPTKESATGKDPRIGYLLRMYPRFSQTFVVNEILELERQNLDLRIVSLHKPNEGVFHESIARVKAQADYLPEHFSGQIRKQLRYQWNWFRRSPRLYLEAAGVVRRYKNEKWIELAQAVDLIRWARKNKVEHIHVHFGTDEATVALLANILGGLSYSITLHAFDIFRDNVEKSLLARKINASRFVVTVCQSNRQYMIDHLPGVDPVKIRVNYNGIDLERFAPNGSTREDNTVFAVGRLIEKKGFIDLIHAIAILKNEGLSIQCAIAGDGRERSNLKREIKKLDIASHVRLVGPLSQDKVRARMQEAACFALPCVQAKDGNVDALPTVLLESLACGCPTVSTRLSGIPEIIDDYTSGLLVDPNSETALAQAIRSVLVDPSLAAKLSQGGITRAKERFDVTCNVATMRQWLCDTSSAPKKVKVRSAANEESAAIEAA